MVDFVHFAGWRIVDSDTDTDLARFSFAFVVEMVLCYLEHEDFVDFVAFVEEYVVVLFVVVDEEGSSSVVIGKDAYQTE